MKRNAKKKTQIWRNGHVKRERGKLEFKKNFHLSKNLSKEKVQKLINNYPSQYPTPKYLSFAYTMILKNWKVSIYEAKVSKYIYCVYDDLIFKIRFSNHKPTYTRENENDSDFYVGISNLQVSTTEQIIQSLTEKREFYEYQKKNIDDFDKHETVL